MGSRSHYDNAFAENHSSGSSHSGDFSLLHEIEDGSYHNGDLHGLNYDFTNIRSAFNETTPDPNAEVNAQLTKFISDHHTLKDALEKNNSMMSEQLSTINAWRDVMITKTKQQEQNLQEAKENISSLEKENSDLLKKLDNLLKEKSQNREATDSCTKCEILESTLNRLFTMEERGISSSELNNFQENLEQNLIAICQLLDVVLKSKMPEKRKNVLSTFMLLLKFKIASLNSSFCATDEETGYEVVHQLVNKEECNDCSQANSEIHKKLEELQEIINKKDEELSLLRNENEQLSEKVAVCNLKLEDAERAPKAKFELLNRQLEIKSSESAEYKERCEKLQEQLDEYQEKLHRAKMSGNFGQKIKDLEDILKIEQRANQKDKEEVSRLRVNCEKLQVDYERVTKLLEIVSRDEREKIEKLQTLNESNEKNYIEQIDRLTAQLMEVQEQLNECSAEKEKLSHVAEESENIPALKAQIQVYKADYFTTVAEKKSALDEVERLSGELKKYQKSDRRPRSRNPSPSSFESIDIPTEGHRNEEHIECPICNFEFTSLRAAENHIEYMHKLDSNSK